MQFKKKHAIIGALLVIIACGQRNNLLSDVSYVNCLEAKEQGAPLLSLLASEIRYVQLETCDSALLRDFDNIVLTDKYIVVDGGYQLQCYVFDKTDGKYLHTVGIRGNQGPMGYKEVTVPLYISEDEILLKGWDRDSYNIYSLRNGELLRKIPEEVDMKGSQAYDRVYPLNDSTMLLYSYNKTGDSEYGLKVRAYSGTFLKKFTSTNNFKRTFNLYLVNYPNEIIFYNYEDQVYFHEFTSDTIFRLTAQLEREACYVLGLEDKLPKPEIRNSEKIEGKYIKFDNILETNRYLLLKSHRWTKDAYIYDKQAEKTVHTNDEKIEGFINDLDGFLPFWPIDRGRGKASNEMWSVLSANEYLEGVEKTGKNPLGIELNENDNPVIVLVQ